MSDLFNASIVNEYSYILPICNLLPYNSGASTGGVVGNVSGTNPLSVAITIPSYVKDLNIDYVSFGANPEQTVVLPSQLCVVQIVYDTEDSSGFLVKNFSEASVALATSTEYAVEIRVRNGDLIPLDIKSIKSIKASTSSASTINLATPTNITLWKRFIKSSSSNKATFMVDNKLPSGPNETAV